MVRIACRQTEGSVDLADLRNRHKVVLNWINKHVGLPPYTTEDPDGDAFWGGVRGEAKEVVEMEGQGKPET